MYCKHFDLFKEVWAVDFEYGTPTGGHPEIRCMVASEFYTGRTIKLWVDELGPEPPFNIGSDSLFVAYFSSAEFNCFLKLGWPKPKYIFDLFVEFKNLTCGTPPMGGYSLLGAISYFGLTGLEATEKEEMRDLALRGEIYSAEEKKALMDYCESDVMGTLQLLPKLLERTENLPQSLLRGRYMWSVGSMEYEGVPLDVETFGDLKSKWDSITGKLIEDVNSQYGVYDKEGHWSDDRFEDWLTKTEIPWPRLEGGKLDLQSETFRSMSISHPIVGELGTLRHALSQMRLSAIEVGPDGRTRCMLSPFSSRTSRNQPSNSRFIFGAGGWLRNLIQADPGMAVCELDFEQQEFGVMAALFEDDNMKLAYQSGDPYLEFAKQAGAVPEWATKETHSKERELFKQCVLGVQYGMEAESLSRRINDSVMVARRLLRSHREVYSRFWKLSQYAVDYTILSGKQSTVFGWTHHLPHDANAGQKFKKGQKPLGNPRMLRNFFAQANGAEMLRLACIFAIEDGIRVCAPVHDAIMITSPVEEIDDVAARMAKHMVAASAIVLEGFELRVESKIYKHPDNFVYTKRGALTFWEKVKRLLEELK
jgi:DNA polymerase-1